MMSLRYLKTDQRTKDGLTDQRTRAITKVPLRWTRGPKWPNFKNLIFWNSEDQNFKKETKNQNSSSYKISLLLKSVIGQKIMSYEFFMKFLRQRRLCQAQLMYLCNQNFALIEGILAKFTKLNSFFDPLKCRLAKINSCKIFHMNR